MNPKLQGIKWMVLAAFTLSIISIIINKSDFTIGLVETYFLICVVTTIFSYILAQLRCKSVSSNFILPYTIRAISTTSSMMLWFYVLKLLSVNEATAVSYITPLLNVVAGVVVFREHITLKRIVAVLIGFLGILMIIRPVFCGEIYSYGAALLTVFIWGLGDILIKSQTRQDTATLQIFYVNLITSIILLPVVIYNWQLPTSEDIIVIILIGMLQFINFYAVLRAYKHSDLSIVVPFDFSRILFTLGLTYIFFGETINMVSFGGSLVIAITTIYLVINLKKSYR